MREQVLQPVYGGQFLPQYSGQRRPKMVTFRLGDALPRKTYLRLRRSAGSDEKVRALYEEYLDRGEGGCLFTDEGAAQAMIEVLRSQSGERYQLQDWVLMPNHGHVIYGGGSRPMWQIVEGWKSEIRGVLGRELTFGRGYLDRYARSPEHLFDLACYVLLNPVRAGLVEDPFDWPYSSIHDYPRVFQEELRRWYEEHQEYFWETVEI